MRKLLETARQKRWLHVAIAILRILLGFAFLPAGVKKVINQPFTDAHKTGAFHDFLHAFHDTGVFYQFVGAVQIIVAVLLMTQTFATAGALLALPLFTAIMVFCYSTGAIPTAFAVTLMWLGVLALLAWDFDRWRAVVFKSPAPLPPEPTGLIDHGLWRACGGAILVLYLAITAASGGVYRPRGIELDNPAFWTLPLITLFPIVTLIIEQRRRGKSD